MDLQIARDKVSSFEMDVWVSVEAGFEGDVVLGLNSSDISESETTSAVIAKAIPPISVESKISDVKIGYQWQKVADIDIIERKAGALKRNTTVELFINDGFIERDNIYFAPDFITEVNSTSNISFSKPTVYNGAIQFTIDRQSYNTPATIRFSNVYVKIDRTVPESNERPYFVVVGGTAVAANYYKNVNVNISSPGAYDPLFGTPGIGTDFLEVVTSAVNEENALTTVVRVTIGSNEVIMGRDADSQETLTMDTEAYISPLSNSTMVPLRFVSLALGIPESQIMWDNEKRSITIINGARIIQFKVGSSDLTINGVTTTMYSPDNEPRKVTAEIKDNRSFIPFRALGYALGVSVGWDETAKTAIFNSDLLDGFEAEYEGEKNTLDNI
jgi:hypothetical protein